MTRQEKIEFTRDGLKGYARLNDRSKERTSKVEWITFKLGCSLAQAEAYIKEAEKNP